MISGRCCSSVRCVGESRSIRNGSRLTVLARFVANAEFVSGTIYLSGGTNAAPTGQGLTDVTTLRARGVAVFVNGE
jgi:hypothetical protein